MEHTNYIPAEGYDPLTNECPEYDTKQSDSKAPLLEHWDMWSTPSMP